MKGSSPALTCQSQPWAYAAWLNLFLHVTPFCLPINWLFQSSHHFLVLTHSIFFLLLTLSPFRMLLMAFGNLGICHSKLNPTLRTLLLQEILPPGYPSPVRWHLDWQFLEKGKENKANWWNEYFTLLENFLERTPVSQFQLFSWHLWRGSHHHIDFRKSAYQLCITILPFLKGLSLSECYLLFKPPTYKL